MEKYYKPKEVANILNCHVETIRRKIRSGKISVTKFGLEYRISETELNRYLKEGEK